MRSVVLDGRFIIHNLYFGLLVMFFLSIFNYNADIEYRANCYQLSAVYGSHICTCSGILYLVDGTNMLVCKTTNNELCGVEWGGVGWGEWNFIRYSNGPDWKLLSK